MRKYLQADSLQKDDDTSVIVDFTEAKVINWGT